MDKKDIQNLPIQKFCANNCVLFLWVTAPCLEEGLELIKKWGFTYKTKGFCWVKKIKNLIAILSGWAITREQIQKIALLQQEEEYYQEYLGR